MPLTFDYNLGNAGWAEATISDGTQSCHMTVSYLHDTLGNLVESVNLLLQGVNEAKVIFKDEPGEHIMFLVTENGEILDIEIRWFKDFASYDLLTKKEFEIIFKGKARLLNFSNEILKILERIYDKEGSNGYKEKWVLSDFPLKGLEKLRELLKST
jgi:hypothetical protein